MGAGAALNDREDSFLSASCCGRDIDRCACLLVDGSG